MYVLINTMNREAVIGIIWDVNRKNIAVGRKGLGAGHMSGKIHIPGETKNEGETDADALVRMGQEELDVELQVVRLICDCITPSGRLGHWYECQTRQDILTPGSDLTEAYWLPWGMVVEAHGIERVMHWPKEIRRFFGLSE